MPGPVAEERSIREIVQGLKGISRETWIRKWVRWLNELLRDYHVEDVQQALGIIDPTDPEEVKNFILEHCGDLTELECYSKIEEMIRRQGYREGIERAAEYMMERLEEWERQAREIERVVQRYKLPVTVDEWTARELDRIYKNPELDHDEVKRIVKHYLEELGYPEKEAEEIAEKAAQVIDERLRMREQPRLRPARPITLAHLLGLAEEAIAIARPKPRRRRRKTAVERMVEKLAEQAETRILSTRELNLVNFTVQRAQSATPAEAVEKLKRSYRVVGAIVGSPAQVFTFSDEPAMCMVRYIPKLKTWIIEKCDKPVLVAKAKKTRGGITVYYQIIPGEEIEKG